MDDAVRRWLAQIVNPLGRGTAASYLVSWAGRALGQQGHLPGLTPDEDGRPSASRRRPKSFRSSGAPLIPCPTFPGRRRPASNNTSLMVEFLWRFTSTYVGAIT